MPSLRRWVRVTSAVKASRELRRRREQGRPTSLSSRSGCKGLWPVSRVDLAVVFHLDPGQGGFVELGQRQIARRPSSMGRSRPSIWSQNASCFPF